MNLTDFRNSEIVKKIRTKIAEEVRPDRVYRIMEVCGTHTMSISRFGIRSMLPSNIDLVSGPGCPVCVTAQNEIDAIFTLIKDHNAIIATFGDMLKVPGSDKKTLSDYRAEGADVRVVYSPLDTLKVAAENPDREIVFVGIGFETTAPTVAALVSMIRKTGAKNVSVLPLAKTMPEVIGLLINDPNLDLDGFLCPGHVTAVTGNVIYEPIIAAGKAAVVTGFEPVDMLSSILEIVQQMNSGKLELTNNYRRVVRDDGNVKAREVLYSIFEPSDAFWRGIGVIPGSGLTLRKEYDDLNALSRFQVTLGEHTEIKGCRCGDVLKGYMKPNACPLFGNGCDPVYPVGPCMVSSEGSCAAYYKFERRNG